jgi:acyl-coenzyme A thioesterase PaaI-like protein
MSPDPLARTSEALRAVQDLLARTDATDDELDAAAATLEELAARLEPRRGDIETRTDWTLDSSLRGAQTLVPPVVNDTRSPDRVDGEVTLTAFHHGANGAAHGGVLPLLFDDVLGQMASSEGILRRTAYLTVNFRNVTPVNRTLRLEAFRDRQEGRKTYYVGRLWDGDTLTADAEGMWVSLRPGAL